MVRYNTVVSILVAHPVPKYFQLAKKLLNYASRLIETDAVFSLVLGAPLPIYPLRCL